MMKLRVVRVSGCCAALMLAIPLVAGCSQAASETRDVKAAAAAPAAPFPVPVVKMHGAGSEMGAEHGRQLGPAIQSLHSQYLNAWFDNAAQRFMMIAAAKGFENHLLQEHRDEVHALAASTQINANQMMLAQCFLDLSPMTACSTIALPAEASPDGVARMGRNLDFPSFNLADKQSLVFVFKPKDRYAFAAVGWPGLVGVLTGMNEHGLTLANMEVTRKGSIPVAMPYTLLYRTVLEQCHTVDEAIKLLESTKRQTANNLMLMDADGHRAVVEIRPQSITVRRGLSGEALMSTNHQRGQDGESVGLCWRYDRLREMSQKTFGRIDTTDVQQMM